MSLQFTISIECPALERIALAIERLVAIADKPPMPELFSISANKGLDNMLQFSIVGLVAPGAPDVVSRELSVQVGASEPLVQSIAVDATESTGFAGADNDVVVVSLTDIDDAGNRSEARVQSFQLTDTIAPPQPGEFGLRVDAEV